MISPDLRIVFAGTPEFAASHLDALIKAKCNIVSVYSQPDRPTGRGKRVLASPVKALALEHGLCVHQASDLSSSTEQEVLAALKPDVMVVVAYGLLLPLAILNTPRLGCINVHASLLPRWRGAAPIERALMAGDAETGISIMQMDEGLDTGPVISKQVIPIDTFDNSMSLTEHLIESGCQQLCEALSNLPDLLQRVVKQDESLATYAKKMTKAEALIDWQQSATVLHNLARAMYPRSPAFCQHQGKRLRIIDTEALNEQTDKSPGTIVRVTNKALDVACRTGILRIRQVQPEGKKFMDIASVLNGHPDFFKPGMLLGAE